jgi:hypothetical protein
MNIRHFAIFATAATLSLAAAADPVVQPAQLTQADTAPLQENRAFRLTPDEAHRMRGAYQLDDGRMLVVTSHRSQLYAQIDGKTEELVPVADHAYVARDSRVRLTFNPVPFGDEVVVTPALPSTLAVK